MEIRYFSQVPVETEFKRGESIFVKVSDEHARCIVSGHDGDVVGEECRFGYSVVVTC